MSNLIINNEETIIVFASNNVNKLREVRTILEPYGIKVLSLKEVGVDIDPEENGQTFSENATKKVEAIYAEIYRKTGKNLSVVGDDSGLCLNVRGGFPGVNTKRFAPGTDADRNNILLSMLDQNNREAEIRTAIAYYDGKNYFVTESVLPGLIALQPLGTNGFGYDPIFIPTINNPSGKTLAQMTEEEKNAVSPRGIALRESVAAILEKVQLRGHKARQRMKEEPQKEE